jgi:hypothetical protein
MYDVSLWSVNNFEVLNISVIHYTPSNKVVLSACGTSLNYCCLRLDVALCVGQAFYSRRWVTGMAILEHQWNLVQSIQYLKINFASCLTLVVALICVIKKANEWNGSLNVMSRTNEKVLTPTAHIFRKCAVKATRIHKKASPWLTSTSSAHGWHFCIRFRCNRSWLGAIVMLIKSKRISSIVRSAPLSTFS